MVIFMKKQKAVLLVSLLLAADVFALPAGGRIKKHIGLVFDVMSTTPSTIAELGVIAADNAVSMEDVMDALAELGALIASLTE